MLRRLEIDLAVNLNGLSGQNRNRIFAMRAAPLQAHYLGYAGTMAAPFMDYVIADRNVIPEENQRHYTEKVAYLPDCYLPHDSQRRIATPPARKDAGLPDRGFVFASFNNNFKITPEVFEVWTRLLQKIDGSVLWLRQPNPDATVNLLREARDRHVDPARVIFARRVGDGEHHVARLRLADLFLDTFPYNGHATTLDALWAGVPVLTCAGHTFAGRVAASVLKTAGFPELITESLPDYERAALWLAQSPAELQDLRARISANRDTSPLFDTIRFTRALERAYAMMCDRQRSALRPASFEATV